MPIELGVNGVKKAKVAYAGIPNVGTKKLIKGFKGDANGVPKLFYKSSTKYVKIWSPNKNDFVNADMYSGIYPVNEGGKSFWRVDWIQPNGEQFMRIPITGNVPPNAINIKIKINNIINNEHTKTTIGWYRESFSGTILFEDSGMGDMEATLPNLSVANSIFGFYFRFYWVVSSFEDGLQVWENVSIEYEIES